jgi:hypothetical protein
MASFPKPYINTVPMKDGQDPMIETVPFDKMGIGANTAGLPKGNPNSSSMGLSHVGGSKDSKG